MLLDTRARPVVVCLLDADRALTSGLFLGGGGIAQTQLIEVTESLLFFLSFFPFLFKFVYVFFETGSSLCGPGWPQINGSPLLPASRVLGLCVPVFKSGPR